MTAIIYGAILSPFVRKTLGFAAEKGIAVEMRPGGMGQGDEAAREASPFGKMPSLRDPGAAPDGSDYLLADSTAICTYWDARHPEPALIPAEPCARGEVIWLDEFSDTILTAAGGKMFFNRIVLPRFMGREGDLAAADHAEQVELPRVLDWLEQRIGTRTYLVGDALTLADVAVAAPFMNIRAGGFTIDAGRWPQLVRWLTAIEARPALAGPVGHMIKALAKLEIPLTPLG